VCTCASLPPSSAVADGAIAAVVPPAVAAIAVEAAAQQLPVERSMICTDRIGVLIYDTYVSSASCGGWAGALSGPLPI